MSSEKDQGWGRLQRYIAKKLAAVKLNQYESQILWVIVYKTIAFNKIEDRIPQSQFVKETRIDQRNLERPINSLIKKGLIYKKGSIYGVVRDKTMEINTSLQMYNRKYIPTEGKYIPTEVKNTSLQMDSEDSSKDIIKKKAYSKLEDKEQIALNIKMLEKVKADLKSYPDRKIKERGD